MTAAGDSTCSQLKQDTHILRLKFQIFSIKKTLRRRHALDLDIVSRQDSRDLGRLYASVQSTHTHTHTVDTRQAAQPAQLAEESSAGGQADGHGHMYRTSLPRGAVSSSSNAACFFTCVLFFLVLLVFLCVLCVSILFQMSCVCMRTKTTTATTTTKDTTRQRERERSEQKLSGADVSSTGCKQQNNTTHDQFTWSCSFCRPAADPPSSRCFLYSLVFFSASQSTCRALSSCCFVY